MLKLGFQINSSNEKSTNNLTSVILNNTELQLSCVSVIQQDSSNLYILYYFDVADKNFQSFSVLFLALHTL